MPVDYLLLKSQSADILLIADCDDRLTFALTQSDISYLCRWYPNYKDYPLLVAHMTARWDALQKAFFGKDFETLYNYIHAHLAYAASDYPTGDLEHALNTLHLRVR